MNNQITIATIRYSLPPLYITLLIPNATMLEDKITISPYLLQLHHPTKHKYTYTWNQEWHLNSDYWLTVCGINFEKKSIFYTAVISCVIQQSIVGKKMLYRNINHGLLLFKLGIDLMMSALVHHAVKLRFYLTRNSYKRQHSNIVIWLFRHFRHYPCPTSWNVTCLIIVAVISGHD